eukprot:6190754-Pleurochrysis_carterae.AAC.1
MHTAAPHCQADTLCGTGLLAPVHWLPTRTCCNSSALHFPPTPHRAQIIHNVSSNSEAASIVGAQRSSPHLYCAQRSSPHLYCAQCSSPHLYCAQRSSPHLYCSKEQLVALPGHVHGGKKCAVLLEVQA